MKRVFEPATVFLGAFACSLAMWLLLWRGSTPMVMGDEFRFAHEAFTKEPDSLSFGNYFSHFLINLVSDMPGDWYSNVKLGNVFFVSLACLAIYFLIAGHISRAPAVMLSIGFAFMPMFVYVGTALPEVVYYSLLFLSLALLTACEKDNRVIFLAGAIAGLALLAKPHALIFIFAVACALLIISRDIEISLSKRILRAVGYFVSALTARILIALIVAGPGSLNLFGTYSSVFQATTSQTSQNYVEVSENPEQGSNYFGSLVQILLDQAPLYLVAFSFTYLPLVVVGLVALGSKPKSGGESVSPVTRLIYLVLVFAVVLYSGVALGFSGLVTLAGDDHAGRVLFRYVDFLYPLVLFFSTYIAAKRKRWPTGAKAIVMASVIFSIGASIILDSWNFKANPADSAMLSFYATWPVLAIFIAALLVYLIFREGPRQDFIFFSVVSVPIVGLGFWFHLDVGRYFNQELDYLKSAQALGINEVPSERVLFVASNNFIGYSAMMHTNSFDSGYLFVNPYSQIDVRDFATEYDRIVALLPTEALSVNGQKIKSFSEVSTFKLFEVEDQLSLGYSADNIGVVNEWGYWVNGSEITLTFPEELERGDIVRIVFRVHPRFDGDTLLVSLGQRETALGMPNKSEAHAIEIEVEDEGLTQIKLDSISAVDLSGPHFIGGQVEFSIGILDATVQ